MENKTALQIFCENLEHNMSIETFSFYNLLKKDCLEIEKQQTIEVLDKAISLIKEDIQLASFSNQVYGKHLLSIIKKIKSKL